MADQVRPHTGELQGHGSNTDAHCRPHDSAAFGANSTLIARKREANVRDEREAAAAARTSTAVAGTRGRDSRLQPAERGRLRELPRTRSAVRWGGAGRRVHQLHLGGWRGVGGRAGRDCHAYEGNLLVDRGRDREARDDRWR